MTNLPSSRGRPRTGVQPLTSAERTRRRRERLRVEGTVSQTVNLTPEMLEGLEEWARLMNQQKSTEEMIEATVGFGVNKMLEPGKQEMLAAFADPNTKPVGRLLALLGAMGVQALQTQIENEINPKPRAKR